jgi:hypothetical protein
MGFLCPAAVSPAPVLVLNPTPDLDPGPSEAQYLQPNMVSSPSQETSWPSVVATKNELRMEKPHLLAFPPDLVAKQLTLMDAVSI